MRNTKLKIVFLTDSVLKFSTEIYVFINYPKNWDFLYFLIDSSVEYSPKKQIWCKIFVHGINKTIFRAPPGNSSLKTQVLIGLITKR